MRNNNYLTCRWCSQVGTGFGAGLHRVRESCVYRNLLQNRPASQEINTKHFFLIIILFEHADPGGRSINKVSAAVCAEGVAGAAAAVC